jgi:archaeal type IV pilus assembly protein PilA
MNALRNRLIARRNRRRGVSPIIATILLVAITVVLAAVLYVLISGLTHTGASTPYSLGMSSPIASVSGSAYYYQITVSPQSGLTTGMFGLSLKGPTGTSLTSAAKPYPAACKFTAAGTAYSTTSCTTVTGCTASAASPCWYAVLYWLGNGSIANVYNASAGWTAPTLPVTNAETLVVIAGISLTGSSDTLNAFSTGSSSVSGQSGAF